MLASWLYFRAGLLSITRIARLVLAAAFEDPGKEGLAFFQAGLRGSEFIYIRFTAKVFLPLRLDLKSPFP